MNHDVTDDLIRGAVARSTSPDPRVIAREIAKKVPVNEVDALVESYLIEAVIERIRVVRRQADPDPRVARKEDKPGRSKWDQLRVSVGGSWKFLADCTVADVRALADEYDDRAKANQYLAAYYRSLAAKMVRHKATRVGDLDPGQVAA